MTQALPHTRAQPRLKSSFVAGTALTTVSTGVRELQWHAAGAGGRVLNACTHLSHPFKRDNQACKSTVNGTVSGSTVRYGKGVIFCFKVRWYDTVDFP